MNKKKVFLCSTFTGLLSDMCQLFQELIRCGIAHMTKLFGINHY